MAILNGLYIHVVDESVSREVDATSHPVESGIPTTDTIKARALSISLSGKIVDYGSTKASEVLAKIKTLQESGSLIDYQGRNVASSMQIRSFSSSYPNTISGGAEFSMELVQVRIAKSAYVPKKASTTEKENAAKNDTSTIKVGDKVVFKGGPVYVSSDATKPAATRGRSTCKVTIINERSWSLHDYHLISTDGGKVYGWVDKANIECVASTGTSGKTNAGTQQVKSSKKREVWHKVKQGDILWKLVNKYKLKSTYDCRWVMNNNKHAFTSPNNARTLKVGASLKMGYK